ncbi:serine/threonine protein kinase [Streptomyces sp. NPDC048282]|uniref:serine/threonine protein kinase n=1 Tax=Streptomyces sp. NPDC048282 TaxID=3365528 RepID=UPI00371F0EEB
MEAGEVLDGRYRVEEALDQGGMGSIWTAADLETGQTVAVKVLRLDAYTLGRLSPTERTRRRVELLQRFEREGSILEELNHPGIPRLLHRGYLREEPYIVMEYVEGVTLREFLYLRRPFPFDAAIAIAAGVAEALGHAHASGVVHRDLKPGNVVVAFRDGAVKLLDFGIAHLTDPDATRYTALGDTPGTVGYMAPEQRRGQKDIFPSADLYAFGCVLFELLTGERPFEDRVDRNKDMQHLEDLPPRLRNVNLGIPEELDDLVWDLLAKAPADRPGSIEEVLQVLCDFLPRPGDAAPDPQLDPDPTARYRLRDLAGNGGSGPVVQRDATRRSRRRRGGGWLGRNHFAGHVALARAELADAPGSHCAELLDLLPKAVADWGAREPIVLEGRFVCADAALLDGRTDDAMNLYAEVADGGDVTGPLALEAELGVAECHMAQRDSGQAFRSWQSVVRRALTFSSVSDGLIRRVREVANELSESGYEAEVADLLCRLPEV